VHRLWEPLATKQAPPNAYAAKFSIPYAIAVALLKDNAGLGEYTDALAHSPELRALAAKVSYTVDPANPYPKQFTGHVKATLTDGTVFEHRQGYFKGGVEHPLSDADLRHKFHANCAYGGMPAAQAQALELALGGLFEQKQITTQALG
jgi:2-methylcitrate dehydratase PrpD